LAIGRWQLATRSLPPLPIGGRDLAEKLDFVQAFAGTFRNRAQGILSHVHR
jgi:hypothetical protein